MKERFKLMPFVAIILKQDNKVLFMKRKGTGFYDGKYALIGGGVDGNETILKAAIREVEEEVGIKIAEKDLKVVHVLHHKHTNGTETVGFFVQTEKWVGVPKVMEQDLCEELDWFEMGKFPKDIIPTAAHVFKKLQKGIFYSEQGWD